MRISNWGERQTFTSNGYCITKYDVYKNNVIVITFDTLEDAIKHMDNKECDFVVTRQLKQTEQQQEEHEEE